MSQRALDFNPSTAFSKNLDIGTVIPQDVPGAELATNVTLPEFDISLDDFSGMVMQPTEDAYQASLANAISLGEENALLDAARTAQGAQATAEEASRSAGSLIGYLQRQELGPLANFSLRRGSGSSMNPLLAEAVSPYFNLPMSPYESPSTASVGVGPLTVLGGSPSYGMENGGFIGMQTGGLTADEVLKRQGLLAGSKQLGLFQSFDPSGIQQSTQKIGQDLLGMTEGQGLSSLGGGFGAQAGSVSTMAKQGQESLEQQIQQEQRDYESSVLGTAADIVAGGGEFREYYGNFTEEQKERERAGAGLINREQGASFQPPTGFGYEGEQKLGLDNVMYTWSSATNQWIPNQAGGADLATMGAYSTGG